MAETPVTSGTAPVTDRRPVPRGVIPKGLQMWVMVGVAVGMVAIIMFTGHSEPAPRATSPATSPPPGLNPDRLRDYQDRLRALDERARLQAMAGPSPSLTAPQVQDDRAPRQMDPLAEERKRREYESLFAGNVVLSRRPAGQQPLGEGDASRRAALTTPTRDASAATPPNLDQVADAVV